MGNLTHNSLWYYSQCPVCSASPPMLSPAEVDQLYSDWFYVDYTLFNKRYSVDCECGTKLKWYLETNNYVVLSVTLRAFTGDGVIVKIHDRARIGLEKPTQLYRVDRAAMIVLPNCKEGAPTWVI